MNQRLRKIGVMLPLLAVTGLLVATISAPRLARASTGQTILETMGISIAVGTVLGASTLPFYDQPGKHLTNLGFGAAAGAVAGVGALVYQWIADRGEHDDYGKLGRAPVTGALTSSEGRRATRAQDSRGSRIAWNGGQSNPTVSRPTSPYPAQFWTPLVSLNW
jgi:hypothetical protein